MRINITSLKNSDLILGKTINVIPHRELVSINENQNKNGADITQAQETPVFELYKIMESDILKDKNNWDEMRKRFLKPNEKHLADTEKCKRCVWANKESSKIFCSRYKCTEGKNYV